MRLRASSYPYPTAAGKNNGFPLNATFLLPTDIWAEPKPFGVNNRFYVADSGNSTIRVIGYDVEQQQDTPMQVISTDAQPDFSFAVTPLRTSVYASLPASLRLSQLNTNHEERRRI